MLLAVSLILSTFVRFGPLSRGLETNGGTDANGGYSEEEVARMAHTLAVKAVMNDRTFLWSRLE
jgi:hypothetical protein